MTTKPKWTMPSPTCGVHGTVGEVRVLAVAGAEPRVGGIMSNEGEVIVRHSEKTVRWGGVGVWGTSGSQGHVLLMALHLEEANQDTESGGQLHPGSVSGCHIECGVQVQQEGIVRSQRFHHTAHHHGHDGKGAYRGRSAWSEEGRTQPALDPGS